MSNRDGRHIILIIVVFLLMLTLGVRLFVLTVKQQEKWETAASAQNTKEIVTTAPRGKIYDRNGILLADNTQKFIVTFNVSGLGTKDINDSAWGMIQLFEKNGDSYVDNFPIVISKKGNFSYTFETNKKKYLKKLGLEADAEAEETFNVLREKYEVDTSLDRYEALQYIQETYGVYPPISVKSMRFTYDVKQGEFLTKYGLDTGLTAEEAFRALREKYSIDPTLSDTDARKIFCIREEIKNTGYNKYRSSTIATNVCKETVAYVEEMNSVLKGVEVASTSARTYPKGNMASHILGYMGSISDNQADRYVNELGYQATDLIGKDGIEASMEPYLHGTDGIRTILVNSAGDYVETLSETEPVAGQDVYLTIDTRLQKIAEKTLAKCIDCVRTGDVFTSKYGNRKLGRYGNCKSGATVVVEVETGDVLAMASYPDYDPNIFAQGITTEDWESVQSTNPRDPLAPTPLYNNATMTSVQPGSTFKPVTAIAALRCGLDPTRKIRDGGYIQIGGLKFGCSNWNNYRSTHGYENLVEGIQNSCNYYFYCIASGKDWNTGASLGYKTKITIEKIMDVAREFGLGQKTGVELPETVTDLASAEKKMNSIKYSLWSYLYQNASKYWPNTSVSNDEKLREEISLICSWIEENPSRTEISAMLDEETTVKGDKVSSLTDMIKYSYFNMAQWTVGDEFNIAIGQGDNAYTPLQMARYIATLGNDGIRNQISVVKKIGDQEKVKEEPYEIDVEKSQVTKVLEGMRRVVTNGTLAGTFYGFPIEVCGKTGTAQKDGRINPVDEVAYVQEHLAQFNAQKGLDITWKQIRKKMDKIMKAEPTKYTTDNSVVDKALIELSDRKISQTTIDQFKPKYDNFAWTVTLAPKDNPKIAVVTLLIQGGYSYNAAVVNRELIGEYFKLEATNKSYGKENAQTGSAGGKTSGNSKTKDSKSSDSKDKNGKPADDDSVSQEEENSIIIEPEDTVPQENESMTDPDDPTTKIN